MTDVTLDTAKEIIATAEEKANEIDVPMCIAVMDEGANLVGFHRMDDALLASIDIAQNKAYSSVSLKLDTKTIHEVSQPGESLYGLGNTNDGRIITFGGGFPTKRRQRKRRRRYRSLRRERRRGHGSRTGGRRNLREPVT